MGLTFIGYNLKEYKYILASLLRHQSQPTLVGGRQTQDVHPTRQLEHSLPPDSGNRSQGTSSEEVQTLKKAGTVILAHTACIAPMAAIPLTSCLLPVSNLLRILMAT